MDDSQNQKIREKIAIFSEIADSSFLQTDPRLNYFMEKINEILPDKDIVFTKKIISEKKDSGKNNLFNLVPPGANILY